MSEAAQTDLAATSDLPKVFGRYLLLRPLSRGGMGEVFLARSGELSGFEKNCVIKKVLPHLAEDREFIRRFIDEAQVAIKLNHANIASVFEVGLAEGEYFLAIEYVEGRDLRRLIARLSERRERVPLDLALFIVRDVASGLAYAHRKADGHGKPLNLVHCDISPPNVLVSFEGEVKIIDFGIAKSALRIQATNPRSGFGKLGYMAPEQLVRGGVVDRRTDIYACGVLLYELLTGERLFHIPENYDYKEIARAVTQGKHGLPSQRDPALYDFDPIVVKSLAVDQNKRYASAEELRDDLSVALARVNPTMTGDRLGQLMRHLFEHELAEERQFMAQASALDMSRWASELTDSRTHTVSFALAGGGGAEPEHDTTPVGLAVAPLDPDGISRAPQPGEASLTMLVAREAEAEGGRRRRRVLLTGGVVALSLGAGAALALALSSGDGGSGSGGGSGSASGSPVAMAPPPAPTVEPVAAPPPPTDIQEEEEPEVVIEPIDDPPAEPRPRVIPKKVKPPPPKAPPKEKERPAAAESPTQAQVEAKFQAVKREYADFRKAYGSRLDDEWNDILGIATYGRGEDRYKKLSSKLDRFRQRMAEVRKGG